jgi:hypothetical protein
MYAKTCYSPMYGQEREKGEQKQPRREDFRKRAATKVVSLLWAPNEGQKYKDQRT